MTTEGARSCLLSLGGGRLRALTLFFILFVCLSQPQGGGAVARERQGPHNSEGRVLTETPLGGVRAWCPSHHCTQSAPPAAGTADLHVWEEVQLASRGRGPGCHSMVDILPCTERPHSKEWPSPNVNSAEVGKPGAPNFQGLLRDYPWGREPHSEREVSRAKVAVGSRQLW